MRKRWWTMGLAAGGLFVVGSAVWHLTVSNGPTAPLHRFIDLTLIGGAGLGLLYGSYWHANREFNSDEYLRINAWIVGSCLLFIGLGTISLYVGSDQMNATEFVHVAVLNGAVGLLAGVLVGTMHAQAVSNAADAARAEAEAEALAAEQDRIRELTELLRHYVLNGVNIISGYATQLEAVVADESQPALDMIDTRAQMMTTLVEHIRSTQQVDPDAPATIELSKALNAATADLHEATPPKIVPPDDPPAVKVNRRVAEALSLLCEATEKTTGREGTLVLGCDSNDQTVTITFTASPAELPESVKTELFEPIASGIGLEIYLANRILTEGAKIRHVDQNGDTVRFELVVPLDHQP